MRDSLRNILKKIETVCCTADCWTSFHRSFLGVTVHWINPESLARESAIFACKRLTGRHTYDVLAAALQDVFREFKITNKILVTVTDNASNFIKAFRVFGREPCEDDLEVDLVDVSAILNDRPATSADFIGLPNHQRCAAHTLNLVANVDAREASHDVSYSRCSSKTLSKCRALWNRQQHSTVSSEIISRKLGRLLIVPCVTRWNSLYDALSFLSGIDRAVLDGISDELALPRLQDEEVLFIEEYTKVSHEAIAKALDILQGEKYTYMGALLALIWSVLKALGEMTPLKVCGAFVDAVKQGVSSR
ncbi:uncharacterized protein ISCGN_005535 [Ixodes scapularis]